MPSNYRVSMRQQRTLLAYLTEHRRLAAGLNMGKGSKLTAQRTWSELAARLNALDDGATKSGERWKRYWIDLKSRTRARAEELRRAPALGGGAAGAGGSTAGRAPPLTEVEKSILSILTAEADSEHNAIHSIPFARDGYEPGPSDPGSSDSFVLPPTSPAAPEPPQRTRAEPWTLTPSALARAPPVPCRGRPTARGPRTFINNNNNRTAALQAWLVKRERDSIEADRLEVDAINKMADALFRIAGALEKSDTS